MHPTFSGPQWLPPKQLYPWPFLKAHFKVRDLANSWGYSSLWDPLPHTYEWTSRLEERNWIISVAGVWRNVFKTHFFRPDLNGLDFTGTDHCLFRFNTSFFSLKLNSPRGNFLLPQYFMQLWFACHFLELRHYGKINEKEQGQASTCNKRATKTKGSVRK